MREIRIDTVGDLGIEFTIYAHCDACRRSTAFPVSELVMRHGRDLRLSDLKARVTCRQCGQRTREIRLVHSGRPDRDRG